MNRTNLTGGNTPSIGASGVVSPLAVNALDQADESMSDAAGPLFVIWQVTVDSEPLAMYQLKVTRSESLHLMILDVATDSAKPAYAFSYMPGTIQQLQYH